MEVDNCNYKLTSGEYCDGEIFREDRCRKHALVDTHDSSICKHKITSGPRKGFFCTEKPFFDDDYCPKHALIETHDDNMCKFVFVKGPRQGGYCRSKAVLYGFCVKHANRQAIDKPKSFGDCKTCKHVYSKGDRKGKYCSAYGVDEYGYCTEHKLKTLSAPTNTSCKIMLRNNPPAYCAKKQLFNGACRLHCFVPDESCEYVVKAGTWKGQQCGGRSVGMSRCMQHYENKFTKIQESVKQKKGILRKAFLEANDNMKAIIEEPRPLAERTEKFYSKESDNDTSSTEEEQEEPKSNVTRRCSSTITRSHTCRNRVKQGLFCRVHSKHEGSENDEFNGCCHADVVETRRCKRMVKGREYCPSHNA
jgi:hypothetical protein